MHLTIGLETFAHNKHVIRVSGILQGGGLPFGIFEDGILFY
jgi:hypothetical protein